MPRAVDVRAAIPDRLPATPFRERAMLAGFKGGKSLHAAAVKRFKDAAASEVTFKRLFSKGPTGKDMPALIQAAALIGCPVEDLRTTPVGADRPAKAVYPVETETSRMLPTIDRAAEATLHDPGAVVSASESLMESRLGSLHAFLVFFLADKLHATDAAAGGP